MINQRGTQYEITCFTPEERSSLKLGFKTQEAKTLRASQSKGETLQ